MPLRPNRLDRRNPRGEAHPLPLRRMQVHGRRGIHPQPDHPQGQLQVDKGRSQGLHLQGRFGCVFFFLFRSLGGLLRLVIGIGLICSDRQQHRLLHVPQLREQPIPPPTRHG